MEPLIKIIREYESDTFSASGTGITEQEADILARRLFTDLCTIVESGGHTWCDGVLLNSLLEELRDEAAPVNSTAWVEMARDEDNLETWE